MGLLRMREGEIQKAVKSNNALQSLPINKNRNDHAENSTMNEIKTS